jgi:SAM-dependent methyltransferase
MRKPATRLDGDALATFARKGLRETPPGTPQVGEANAVKVRRVMQITSDLSGRPFGRLRILDLGCGEGVYAIEAALQGARVVALDARDERMSEGRAIAQRHGIESVEFATRDVRGIGLELGTFDVVYVLGLLYHLDLEDALSLLEAACELCTGFTIVDTLVSLAPELTVEHDGASYEGERRREHGDEDSAAVRRSRLVRSIDNPFAFVFTRESLVRALGRAGFTSVVECQLPPEPGKAADRATYAACTGQPVSISTYPWINGMSELEISARLGSAD